MSNNNSNQLFMKKRKKKKKLMKKKWIKSEFERDFMYFYCDQKRIFLFFNSSKIHTSNKHIHCHFCFFILSYLLLLHLKIFNLNLMYVILTLSKLIEQHLKDIYQQQALLHFQKQLFIQLIQGKFIF